MMKWWSENKGFLLVLALMFVGATVFFSALMFLAIEFDVTEWPIGEYALVVLMAVIVGGLILIPSSLFVFFLRQFNKKTDAPALVVKDTHTLVNSDRGRLLKVVAVALASLADNTGKKEDKAAADLAEETYQAHERQQAIVDAGRP